MSLNENKTGSEKRSRVYNVIDMDEPQENIKDNDMMGEPLIPVMLKMGRNFAVYQNCHQLIAQVRTNKM